MRKIIGWAAAAVWLVTCLGLPAWSFGNLTHLYTFNDGTAKDSAGHSDGTLMNGASITSDGKLYFDPAVNTGSNSPSTGQYVQLPNDIVHTSAFTVEAWATTRTTASWQRILDMGNQSGAYGMGFLMMTPYGYSGEGLFSQVSLYDSGGASDTDFVTTRAIVPSINVEHMYAVTFSYTDRIMAIYMDGNLLNTTPATVDPSLTSYTNFWIGRSQYALDPYFDGTIDELRVYDNALTGSQITQQFNAGPSLLVPEPASGACLVLGGMMCLRPRRSIKGR